ncbi:MAG: hypothetical protein GKS00_06085 [Alphaproteobacteria bacterium]|nr:hypothetical protein [Alphaproteobacteria bacterium]
MTAGTDEVAEFIEHVISGRMDAAQILLASDPTLPKRDVFAAACYGDVEAFASYPERLTAVGGPRDWPVLLYLCYSEFQRFDLARREAFLRSAVLLLDAGADPNASFLANDEPQTALYGGCGRANNPGLTKLLLDAGADPNEGTESFGSEALYHAAELPDLECLSLILAAKPNLDKISFCFARKLDFEDIEGARLFLAHGADVNFVTPFGDRMTRLHHAVQRGRGPDTIALLLDHGGDIAARTEYGKTPYALAIRYGRTGVADVLRAHGATDAELTNMDRFVGACAVGDTNLAQALRADLTDELGPDEYQIFAALAGEDNALAVDSMARMGFDPDESANIGPILCNAAWTGAANAMDALLAHGPDLEKLNAFGGTALDTAAFGAGHCHYRFGGMIAAGQPADVTHGDYPRVVKSLLEAGASADASSEYPTGDAEIDALFDQYRR